MSFAAVALILTAVGQQKPMKGLIYEYIAGPGVVWQVAADDPLADLAPLVVSEVRWLVYHGKSQDGHRYYEVRSEIRLGHVDLTQAADFVHALLMPKGYKRAPRIAGISSELIYRPRMWSSYSVSDDGDRKGTVTLWHSEVVNGKHARRYDATMNFIDMSRWRGYWHCVVVGTVVGSRIQEVAPRH